MAPAQPSFTALAGTGMAAAAYSHTYNWQAAINYAQAHALSYTPLFVNDNSCGGDCANFVSQCFVAGAQVNDASWYTYSGTACSQKSSYCGSATWVNNVSLRNWTLHTTPNPRGLAAPAVSSLGMGDIINYDWTGDGLFDHVVMVTVSPAQLICSHNLDRKNVPWNSLSYSGTKYEFTHMYTSY